MMTVETIKGSLISVLQDQNLQSSILPNQVKLLLEKGFDPDSKCSIGNTPLHFAAKSKNRRVLKLLLRNNAEVNALNDNGDTPLHVAARTKKEDIIQLFLDNNSDINIFNKSGKTAFDLFPSASCNVFVKHIVKRQAADLFVNKRNLQCLEDVNKLCSQETKEFRRKCNSELKRMDERVTKDVKFSFYDILTNDLNQVARYTSNECMELAKEFCKYVLPIYSSMLRTKLEEALKRKKLLTHLHMSRNNIFSILPLESFEMITSYISNNDLRNLIKAFH